MKGVDFLGAGFWVLIFFSAPASLSQFSDLSLSDDFLSQALVGWLWRDVVDARMVMLRVVPCKVPTKIDKGELEKCPAAFGGPMGKLELYFKHNVIDDLWLTVKWGKT
jgi:hypothetical protein